MATTHSLKTLSNADGMLLTPNGIHSGMDVTIQNLDAEAYVYIGGSGVTASSFGYRLSPGSAVSFELPGRDALFAISDTNNSQVAILKTGLESGN